MENPYFFHRKGVLASLASTQWNTSHQTRRLESHPNSSWICTGLTKSEVQGENGKGNRLGSTVPTTSKYLCFIVTLTFRFLF